MLYVTHTYVCLYFLAKMNDYGILLKGVQGFKEGFCSQYDLQEFRTMYIFKGTLLVKASTSDVIAIDQAYDCSVNYKVDSEKGVYLYAEPNDVYQLTTLQRDFLLSVKRLDGRLEVLERLAWIESLKKNSEVYVTIATIPTPVKGIIRYIGGLPGEEGRQFGIELIVCIIKYSNIYVSVSIKIIYTNHFIF